jgi:hypothetical protein
MPGSAAVLTAVTVLLTLFFAAPVPAAPTSSPAVAGLPAAEALRLGERMYRQGILPSGEPMLAIVQRDIEVEGTMFSCESCHLRSGLGSVEGKIITLPTNATELFKPFTSAAEEAIPPWEKMPEPIQWKIHRPAYTDETLARALWAGVDPNGREFNWTMPRYQLEDRDMEILVFYLRHLSAAPSPGVTDSAIRFATVIAGDVPQQDREAMLAVLEAHIQARNGQSRLEEERAKSAPFYRKKKTTAYRRLELVRWELKGPPETWETQLADYYRQAPVFAILGGITREEWAPVHAFCETNRIPCILPITRYPVVADSDWYTLYFSKGLDQEGEAAARFLRGLAEWPADAPVVQVYRNDRDGRIISKAFGEARRKLKQSPPQEIALAPDATVGTGFWLELAKKYRGAVVLLWLSPGDLAGMEVLGALPDRPAKIFLAAGLLGDALATVPEAVRSFTYLTYPYRLPQERISHMAVVQSWLKVKNIPVTNLEIQSGMYFAGWLLSSALMMMESDYYRDYFLDGIDMMNDEVYAITLYPRLSFGQGQRYASKGCYVVQLGAGSEPPLLPRSEWVIH